MFKAKTVFVLGAGASNEFGFPLGQQLAEQIRQFVKISRTAIPDGYAVPLIRQALNKGGYQQIPLLNAASQIFSALPFSNSIDDFLNQRQQDGAILRLGKMAIVNRILTAEKESKLNEVAEGRMPIGEVILRNTWLFKLAKMLFKERTPATINNVFENVRFISFNYDRSLELFLAYALSDAFSIPLENTRALVGTEPILHVYGSVGVLPGFSPHRGVVFGDADPNHHDYLDLSDRIRTYTESYSDQNERNFIEEAVTDAKKVVFLGCGYHTQNIQVLRPRNGTSARLIGTVKGISGIDVQAVVNRIRTLLADNIISYRDAAVMQANLQDMTCSELFDAYAMSLTE